MSLRLISLSRDLSRLVEDGYEVEVRHGYLLIKHVPYLNARAEIHYGVLVSELTLAAEATDKPSTHVAMFVGDHPCNPDGSEMHKIKHQSARQELGPDLVVDHSFSSKPATGYADYYEKMTAYVAIISSAAVAIDPTVTARTFAPIEAQEEDDSVFRYIDTASSRAMINTATSKLALGKIAIVGLGGTGAYILDLVAKTPVTEIHLFDGDKFRQHNAFRSPGAASIDDVRRAPYKVRLLYEQYSRMRRGVIPHQYDVVGSNVAELRGMDFIFLALDDGRAKKDVVTKIEEFGIPFIDVGIGVFEVNGQLAGLIRTTTSTPTKRDHAIARISFADGGGNNDYSRNIQIADLNMLNAALAVIKWKKLSSFYVDLDNEHNSVYVIDGNNLINEDRL